MWSYMEEYHIKEYIMYYYYDVPILYESFVYYAH